MPIIKNIAVQILKADDKSPFEEYALMHKKNTNKATCFIESVDGELFDIEFHPLKNFPIDDYPVNPDNYPDGDIPGPDDHPWLWNVRVTVDEAKKPQVRRFFFDDPSNPDGSCRYIVRPRFTIPGKSAGTCVERQWMFTDVAKTPAGLTSALADLSFGNPENRSLMTIDELGDAFTQSSIDKNPEENTKQGSIRIDVFRKVTVGHQLTGKPDLFEDEMDADKEIDPNITHFVQPAKATSRDKHQYVDSSWHMKSIDDNGAPFATFIFYYRSAQKLHQFGVKQATAGKLARLPEKTTRKRSASTSEFGPDPQSTRSPPFLPRGISGKHRANLPYQGPQRSLRTSSRLNGTKAPSRGLHRSNAVVHKPLSSSTALPAHLKPPPLSPAEAIKFAEAMPHTDRDFTFTFGPTMTEVLLQNTPGAAESIKRKAIGQNGDNDVRKSIFHENMSQQAPEPKAESRLESHHWPGAIKLGAKKLITRGKVRIVEKVGKYAPRKMQDPDSEDESEKDDEMDTD